MKSIAIGFAVILVIALRSASAGEFREIELSDGSVVSGEVLSLNKGIYTIKSNDLGTIKLEESKVRVIRPQSSSPGNAAQKTVNNEMQDIQGRMMRDQEVMGLVQSLQNDPEFKKILEDPDVLKAVNEGDLPALMANPRFMRLLNNPTVKEVQKKVK